MVKFAIDLVTYVKHLRKGLIDCFLSNEHRASKTWTKIENFVSLYILLKRAKPTTTKAKIEEEGRLL